jgi:hypothetical protein
LPQAKKNPRLILKITKNKTRAGAWFKSTCLPSMRTRVQTQNRQKKWKITINPWHIYRSNILVSNSVFSKPTVSKKFGIAFMFAIL